MPPLPPSSSSGLRRSNGSLGRSLDCSSLSGTSSAASKAAEMRSKYINGPQFSMKRSTPYGSRSSIDSGKVRNAGLQMQSRGSLRRMMSSRASLTWELSSLCRVQETEAPSKNAAFDFARRSRASASENDAVFDFISKARGPLFDTSSKPSATQVGSTASNERSSQSSLRSRAPASDRLQLPAPALPFAPQGSASAASTQRSSQSSLPTPASDCLRRQSAPAFPTIDDGGDDDDALARFCALQEKRSRPESSDAPATALAGVSTTNDAPGRRRAPVPETKEDAWGQFLESERDPDDDVDMRWTKSLSGEGRDGGGFPPPPATADSGGGNLAHCA